MPDRQPNWPPGGRLGVIDGKGEAGKPRQYYHRRHVIASETVTEDAARHGLEFVKQGRDFHDSEYNNPMYFLVFRKP